MGKKGRMRNINPAKMMNTSGKPLDLARSAGNTQPDTLADIGDRHEDGVHGGGNTGLGVFHGEGKVDRLGETVGKPKENSRRPHEWFAGDECDKEKCRYHQDER